MSIYQLITLSFENNCINMYNCFLNATFNCRHFVDESKKRLKIWSYLLQIFFKEYFSTVFSSVVGEITVSAFSSIMNLHCSAVFCSVVFKI